MPRETYQQSLADLRTAVLEMGELVLGRLETSLDCLADANETLSREVIEGDAEINERYLALETRCADLFALQQPVAGDLRFVTASFKIITDLERIGDLAVNLAQYAQSTIPADGPDLAVGDIGDEAARLLRRSLTAYETENVELCHEVAAADDDIDARCQRASESITRELIERRSGPADSWAVERLLDAVSRHLLTIRDLERIADHAVNIAARTLYMVETDPTLIY